MRIAVIDDDRALCRSLQLHLEQEGHDVSVAYNLHDGLDLLEKKTTDLAFVDLKMPDGTGLDILERLQSNTGGPAAVMITGNQDTKATIEAVRLGAFDYIRKPLDLDAIQLVLEKVIQYRSAPSTGRVTPISEFAEHPHEIVGATPAIVDVVKQVGLLSQSRIPVLIRGESGTGKELVARALHEATSPGRPFVAINCSAVVATLLESDLFGHVRGAFTGADSDKVGRLELAADGTVFFDEIGDMAPELQAKLLRALQERNFDPVGSVEPRPFNARVIAATHRDLKAMLEEGTFREDLYYRLEVSSVTIPPLRDHRGDIPLLAHHLLGRIGRDLQKTVDAIEEKALQALQTHDWPGNIRELENVLTRAAVIARGPVITQDLITKAMEQGVRTTTPPGKIRKLRDVEKDHVEAALHATGWNITQTARLLDISPTTLRKKIGDYALSPPLG